MGYIYFLFNKEKTVYIGKSLSNPMARIELHTNDVTKDFDSYCIMEANKEDLSEIELKLIASYKPILNNPKNRFPELKFNILNKSVMGAKTEKEVVDFMRKKDLVFYEFNKKIYYLTKDRDVITSFSKVPPKIKPTKIIKDIENRLSKIVKIDNGGICLNKDNTIPVEEVINYIDNPENWKK